MGESRKYLDDRVCTSNFKKISKYPKRITDENFKPPALRVDDFENNLVTY